MIRLAGRTVALASQAGCVGAAVAVWFVPDVTPAVGYCWAWLSLAVLFGCAAVALRDGF